MVGERVKKVIGDRPSVVRKAADRFDGPFSERRNNIPERIARMTPDFQQRNLGDGFGIGYIAAGVAVIIEDTVGVPFGASSDTVNIERNGNVFTYTVDTNAPFPNMAKARAAIDAGTGFTGVFTERIEFQSFEKVKERPFRDTYRIKVRID